MPYHGIWKEYLLVCDQGSSLFQCSLWGKYIFFLQSALDQHLASFTSKGQTSVLAIFLGFASRSIPTEGLCTECCSNCSSCSAVTLNLGFVLLYLIYLFFLIPYRGQPTHCGTMAR